MLVCLDARVGHVTKNVISYDISRLQNGPGSIFTSHQSSWYDYSMNNKFIHALGCRGKEKIYQAAC